MEERSTSIHTMVMVVTWLALLVIVGSAIAQLTRLAIEEPSHAMSLTETTVAESTATKTMIYHYKPKIAGYIVGATTLFAFTIFFSAAMLYMYIKLRRLNEVSTWPAA